MIDTVTSPTGLRMPFEALVEALESRGVAVLLDAAHGIGMVPLALDDLARPTRPRTRTSGSPRPKEARCCTCAKTGKPTCTH